MRNMLRLDDVAWVCDHKIHEDVVFPAAGYIAMVGEAIRQLHTNSHRTTDFSLRQVNIKAALVLHQDVTVEILTRMRPVRVTSSLESSSWFEFTISSSNGDSWVKHCTGQARASSDSVVVGEPEHGLEHPRAVLSPASWYRAMKAVSLNYGPQFQGLTSISAASAAMTESHEQKAAAMIRDRRHGEIEQVAETNYQIHPTTIDFCLQAFMVATADGLSRRLNNVFMPTYFEDLYIRRGGADMRIGVAVSTSPSSVIRGTATAVSEGQTVIWMKGVELSPLGDSSAAVDGSFGATKDSIAAARLLWRPDLDSVDPSTLINTHGGVRDACVKVERLSLLCMLETLRRVEHIAISPKMSHLTKFRDWMSLQRKRATNGNHDHVPDAPKLAELDARSLRMEIDAASSMCQ